MKFLCDHMLGTLAKWLRFLGHDAAYPGPIDDRELEAAAAREGRVLLTRDRELAARVAGAVSVRSDDLDEQLLQVLQAFDLDADIAVTRCSVCNAPLREASAEEARGNVPEKVLERQREFWHCDVCGRFYWQGSHWDSMTERVRNLKGKANSRGRATGARPEARHLVQHDLRLAQGAVVLRPMREDDWDILMRWNNDPDVLYLVEGDDIKGRTLEEVQQLYRGVSENAHCFIIEYEDIAVGECWLQWFIHERVRNRHPEFAGRGIQRIDVMIGEKAYWGRGIGPIVIRLLADLAFAKKGAEALFAEVSDFNVRSRRAFEKAGFRVLAAVEEPPGGKAQVSYDLLMTREEWATSARLTQGNEAA